MIKINVELKQLNMSQQIELQPNQKGANIIQLIFNKLDFGQEIRKSIKGSLKVQNVEVDINQTINALEINNYTKVEVILSKNIIIECDHQYLGSIRYNTDVFASVNQFRNHLIKDFIKINSCQIIIINKQNGTQFGDEAWGKYGIFNNIKVGLQITKQQKIKYNQDVQEIKIDIFQPIAQILHKYMDTINIDDLITFKINAECINPDEVYKNLNLPPEQPWNAEISNDYIFRINFEQQGIKKITIEKKKDVFDLIRLVRSTFKIENTIPLQLEYKLKNYILDMNNTIKQECIPSNSYLNLIREPSDNKINILLFNLQNFNKQIERVSLSSTSADLDKFIIHNDNTHEINYYIDNQVIVKALNLKQLDLRSECIIEYQIVEKQKDIQNSSKDFKQIQEIHQPSEDFSIIQQKIDAQLTINFVNKYTNKQYQITIQSSSIVFEALNEILKNETIKDLNCYDVYLNDEKIDKNTRFDNLKIGQNQKLIYSTELIVFQAIVEQLAYTLVVDQNLPIFQIEEQFRKQHNIDKSFSLQLINSESKNESLKQFLNKNKTFIFEFKKILGQTESNKNLIKQLVFSIKFTNLGTQYTFQISQEKNCLALHESIKNRFKLAKNQVIKVFVGDKLIDQKETMSSIQTLINETQKQLTVEFIYFLNLVFENSISKEQKMIEAQLEDTLEQVILKNNIPESNFYYQQKLLSVKKQIKDLPIEDNSTIEYRQMMVFENHRNGQQFRVEVQPEDTLKIIVDRLGVNIQNIYQGSKILDWSTKIKNIQLNSQEKITFDEPQMLHEPSENFSQINSKVRVIVTIGDRKLTYDVDSSYQVKDIKQTVFDQMIKDQGADINKYNLIYEEKTVDTSQPIYNLSKDHEIELKFQLIQ
ncbi:unnamed protein product [Paramecium pentaurelia]|uniref:Ubiquitin-like domain-containing protein n=1 Tax=Paramecium pentaurelia TaxID=43138 RepID=A0A8S1V3Q1_9CILI|nr:unnamed protein product [Paramecium pentaurelia]